MSPPSVLIVDDEVGQVETLADILRAKSYQVATAHSGEAAVAMAQRTPYDIVIMDIRMPGMNGVEALKMIKALTSRTKVIMMTAYTRDELVGEAKRQAALAVLPKPLEMDRLLALIERATQIGTSPHGVSR